MIEQKLQQCRCALQDLKIKKSGKNKFANYNYYELPDFIPSINKLMLEHKMCSNFSISENQAKLILIDTEDKSTIEFTSPIADADVKGCTAIQCLGAIHTYMKRYLYQNAFEIVENDMLDARTGDKEFKPQKRQPAVNPDIDIIEGLKAVDTCNNALEYFRQYQNAVSDKDAFKNAYVKKYKELKAKEEQNDG